MLFKIFWIVGKQQEKIIESNQMVVVIKIQDLVLQFSF